MSKRDQQHEEDEVEELTFNAPKRTKVEGEENQASTMRPRKLTHDAYTVGWICVVESELDAARALLDAEDEPLQAGANDDNIYLLGRMGQHNIVIAFPWSYGTNPAAQTAMNMIRTFTNIRFGLMVGVGGGAPRSPHSKDPRKDIRLGDIVVSEPNGNHGGVLQYDMGKYKDDGRLDIKSYLNKPPGILLKATKMLRSDHRFKVGKMHQYIHEVAYKAVDLDFEDCRFPGRGKDLLYKADYPHTRGEDCSNCDVVETEKRLCRESDDPIIHYGLIASGNAVMKSARCRDKLRDDWDVSCFEMEAAGLMDCFPCVIIRGICDYSDDHKNKVWQPYSAVVAAAYAKDLLRVIHPKEVEDAKAAIDAIKELKDIVTGSLSRIEMQVSILNATMNARQVEENEDVESEEGENEEDEIDEDESDEDESDDDESGDDESGDDESGDDESDDDESDEDEGGEDGEIDFERDDLY